MQFSTHQKSAVVEKVSLARLQGERRNAQSITLYYSLSPPPINSLLAVAD